MPGPFPGMDPYLEQSALWRGVHQGLIFAVNQRLNAALPPGFSANMEERVYIAGPDFGTYPDVTVRRETPPAGGATVAAMLDREAAGVASGVTAPRRVTVFPEQAREPFIEVLHHASQTVVAVVEVLSPGNKAGGPGREEYLRKQHALMGDAAHLIEIDLLRAGQHTVAVPRAALTPDDPRDYVVCLHRGGQPTGGVTGHHFEFWPLSVRDRLPTFPVPLAEGFADVPVDLQAAFGQMYDAGPYRRRIRYADPPDPPLSPEDAAWADALLREKGLRP
jgi:hypothetical protein